MNDTLTPRTDAAEEYCYQQAYTNTANMVRADFARELERELVEARNALIGGGMWSFCRKLLSQGGDIQMDYNAGKYHSYEEYSARLDAAARERVEELRAVLSKGKSG